MALISYTSLRWTHLQRLLIDGPWPFPKRSCYSYKLWHYFREHKVKVAALWEESIQVRIAIIIIGCSESNHNFENSIWYNFLNYKINFFIWHTLLCAHVIISQTARLSSQRTGVDSEVQGSPSTGWRFDFELETFLNGGLILNWFVGPSIKMEI